MQFDTRSLWLYLYFPQLQLDLLSTKQSLAIAIVDPKTNELCQINEAARKKGIKLGMGLASASLLSSDLQLYEYKAELEEKAIVNIANELYLFTSDIVLSKPNALILRVQNMLKMYGDLKTYWHIIQNCLNKQGLHCISTSAYSIQAAKLLARHHRSLITAKRERIQQALSACSLSLTDIDTKDIQKLSRIGLSTYGDLLDVPLSELANRVSRYSMTMINELLGKHATQVDFYQPQTKYSDYIELLYEISVTDKLLPILGKLVDKLSQFLLIRNAKTLSISIVFIQRDHAPLSLRFHSIQAIYKTQDWLDIISLKLESVIFDSPVYALQVECGAYELAEFNNEDMFTQKSTHLAALTLLARLQSKLGADKVSTLRFVPDFRPENSNLSEKIHLSKHASTKDLSFVDRPGFLLAEPKPLFDKIKILKGPERIHTGWWDDHPIKRDYYIAQSVEGQQLWIFKTQKEQWFVHGYFI